MEIIGNSPEIGNFRYGAKTMVNIRNAKVFEGVSFSWSKRFTIGNSDTVDIVIDPMGVTEGVTPVVLPISFTAYGAGPVNIDMYYGVTESGDGTEWVGGNRLNASTNTPGTKVYFDPTVTDTGTKLPFEFMIPSNGTAATAKAGGQVGEDIIYVPATMGKYLFRLSNTDTVDDALCVFSMTLYEV